MARHRHVLTLRFLVDLYDDEVDQPREKAGGDAALLQQRLSRALHEHPAAQWALLSLALGRRAAAETEDALSGALDMTPQRGVGVLAELCDLSEAEAKSFEQAAIHGTLDQALPQLSDALRVLLLEAELYRVVELDAIDRPATANRAAP